MIAPYDTIGVGYSAGRQEDPRFAEAIHRAIGDSESVVNVGAGSGSYEPRDRRVVAVEPSLTMIRQRSKSSAPVVQARADHLPFRDCAFDCALAILTIHHWSPVRESLAELRRVARKTVILTWDQEVWQRFWLFDYCPDLRRQDRVRAVSLSTIAEVLGPGEVIPAPIPHDCVDGFQSAFWRRPAAYLDPAVRARMSGFAQAPRDSYEKGLARLAADLSDGTWQREHSALLERETMALGYRLIVTHISA
ncbi:MAG: class I SAM-dependent methyltransferase [Acidobacteriota bacterium]|nr:class I SAM-dependent methyltransferase [Acidobacteriota bacterium]